MFYDRYIELCNKNGKAPTRVCRELGLSASAPKFWKEGKEPRQSTKQLIADYFGEDLSVFDEPSKLIPVHVITQQDARVLSMLNSLDEKQKNAIINLITELSK